MNVKSDYSDLYFFAVFAFLAGEIRVKKYLKCKVFSVSLGA